MRGSTNQAGQTSIMEYPSCEICGAHDPQPIAQRTDFLLGGDTVYTMCRCGGCGVLYQYPRPTEATMGQHYPSDTSYPAYRPGLDADPPLRRFSRQAVLRRRCALVQRYVQKGRLLDVGCATGDFLSEMRRQPGWSVVGVEPSPPASRYAAEKVGPSIFRGTLNDAPFPDGAFDAVTMWDVLEHVYRPREVIAEVARILRPGGVFVVSHPNIRSIDRQLFGSVWVGYDLPRHTYLYPLELLRQIMAEYHIREVKRTCLYGSHSVLADNLTYLAGNWGWPYQRIGQALRSLPVRLCATPYIFTLDRLLLGGNVTSVFVRHT